MYVLTFWASWAVVALVCALITFFAALGVNEAAVYIAQLVEPYV